MRIGRGLAPLGVSVLLAAGVPLAVGSTAAAAGPPSTIYVATACNGTPDGTEARPFCEIGDAAAVVRPGQTVAVGPGYYAESVVVPSGEPGKPVTFRGYRGPNRSTLVRQAGGPAFRLSGVHDVVIDGFKIGEPVHPIPVVLVENSTDVTISNGSLIADDAAGVDIRGDSRRVTISAMTAWSGGAPAVAVRAGVTDTLLTGISMQLRRTNRTVPIGPGVTVTDAPRTTITNNTIVTDCFTAIEVTGGSGGFRLYNSILSSTLMSVEAVPARCVNAPYPDPATVTPLVVSGAATTDSQVDYNVIDPSHGGAFYSWGGTTYADPAAFHAATGQGAQDIGAWPALAGLIGTYDGYSPTAWSPGVDAALATAPGVLAVDLRGNSHADQPDTPNSGGGYGDRGAIEYLPIPDAMRTTIARAPGGGAFDTVTTATTTHPWAMDGPSGTFSFATGAGLPTVNRTGTARLTHDRAGAACVTVTWSRDWFRNAHSKQLTETPCVMLGAAYNAVAPRRVLDTRSALGVPGTAPIGPDGWVEFTLPAVAAGASAVVLNVTADQPSTSGFLKVYPDGGTEPTASNVNFAAGRTVANLVTVKVDNGKVRVRNGGRGTVHAIADLAGYYANTGNGLAAATPARVLDTRDGAAPVGPNGSVTVDLSTRLPAGTTAAVLNLTATSPTNTGLFTAYPPGSAVPTASNLNFVGGQTVNNMVIAPVVDGKVAFAHTGKGTVHLIADLAGWFAPGAGDNYLPTAPTRLVDTRTTSTPVGPGQTVRVQVNTAECGSVGCGPRTAVVANLTVTDPQRTGYLTVYPDGQARPTQSVLNFTAGQTAASLFTVGLGEDSFLVYNGGKGAVDVIVDQAGFYLED
ncbi:hypothetical protein [Asanoa siamensis]|uniref:Right handed beta helix region n=1 Tax=Asanoa siamensis TaxID=926357 RepID=A0ABQ4CSM9_9ACTN|nr:hypothetical protein [Asanoa siamensis]GIF74293.1 hypothetical protein Asi02nite_38110 [Asanoa siamensis]